MNKKTYLENITSLKNSLVNFKTDVNQYSIGDLTFVFERDDEGFFEENTLTVYDFFSKITIEIYFFSEQSCGCSISPFMKIAGCGSLIPNIIGEINLEQTLEKLLKYVQSNNQKINLNYFSFKQKQYYYSGTKYFTKQFKIKKLDPTNQEHYKLLKEVFKDQIEFDEFNVFYNDKEYRFEFGTNPFKALNINKNNLNKDNTEIPNEDFHIEPQVDTIFYPEISIIFTNYKDMKKKFSILQRKLSKLNHG